MVGTFIRSIYLFFIYYFLYYYSFLSTNTIYAVREYWFAILIFSKYLVLEFWLKNYYFFLSKLLHDKKYNNK